MHQRTAPPDRRRPAFLGLAGRQRGARRLALRTAASSRLARSFVLPDQFAIPQAVASIRAPRGERAHRAAPARQPIASLSAGRRARGAYALAEKAATAIELLDAAADVRPDVDELGCGCGETPDPLFDFMVIVLPYQRSPAGSGEGSSIRLAAPTFSATSCRILWRWPGRGRTVARAYRALGIAAVRGRRCSALVACADRAGVRTLSPTTFLAPFELHYLGTSATRRCSRAVASRRHGGPRAPMTRTTPVASTSRRRCTSTARSPRTRARRGAHACRYGNLRLNDC